jgi:hypothetical protein
MVLVANGGPPHHATFSVVLEPERDGRGGVRTDQATLVLSSSSHRAFGTIV